MVSTVAFIPASPEEVAERLSTKMGLIRQTLMLKGEYLSDPAISGRIHWVASGSGHKLVIRPADAPTLDITSSPSPDTSRASSPSLGDPVTQLPTPANSPAPSQPPVIPAILAMVVQIVPGQSWLYPDGKWTGPTQFVSRFSDVKLLCTGSAPDHIRFHHDYATSVDTLSNIMDQIRTGGYPTTSVLSGPDQYIKVRHNLFAVSQRSHPILCSADSLLPTSGI